MVGYIARTIALILACFFYLIGSHHGIHSFAEEKGGPPPSKVTTEEVIRQNARVEFSIRPVYVNDLLEGELAEVSFRITDATTGQPISPLKPTVWIDLQKEGIGGKGAPPLECKEKIGLFLKGTLSFRPDIDLNSYYILSLNNDATVSVIDPIVGVTGYTRLFSMIYLKRPGEDWVLGRNGKALFVTMPRANQVAVADTETFKVVKEIESGNNPVRIALQPDTKYLWVGNNSHEEAQSGVTVIDPQELTVVAQIRTGAGRHEIAFSDDSLYAFVTNSNDSTLSVIDIQKLQKVKDVRTGGSPSTVAFSRLSRSVYVASEREGKILVIDAKRHEVTGEIKARTGVSVLRFAPGDRWGFVANAKENLVQVFDAADNRIVHTVEVGKEPDKIAFTKAFAYVRSRRSPEVNLIQLSHLGKEGTLPAVRITGGQRPPADSPFDSVADAVIPTPGEGHVLFVNPADNMIYYYMEGMAAPMGSFRGLGGHVPRAVQVLDRSLRELERGLYSAQIRIPRRGTYQVAFLLDSPRVIHCFEFTAKRNPILAKGEEKPAIEFLTEERTAKVGTLFNLRFKLIDRINDEPIPDIKDVHVQTTHASTMSFNRYRAKHVGGGIYRVEFHVPLPGAYYVSFSCPSLKVKYDQLPSLTVYASNQD